MQALAEAGAFKAGVARATPVDSEGVARYRLWLEQGRHASMDYMCRYDQVRADPRLLLDGARSVISVAFNYFSDPPREPGALQVATYALGDDYHRVVRERLGRVATLITDTTGHACRVCVDTAPLRERYWAVKAGLGFIGRNNTLIIPGAGSYFFLGEIITTAPLEPDSPIVAPGCGECRRCLDACPGRALSDNAAVDARRCISYLTIEHRGDLPEGTGLGHHLYGCDECQRVCPYNAHAPLTTIAEFQPRPELLTLTRDHVIDMDQPTFTALTRCSAIKRTRLDGLRRNASACTPTK